MERAGRGETVLLFLDASHFVMGCDFLGYIYGRVRRFASITGRSIYPFAWFLYQGNTLGMGVIHIFVQLGRYII